MVSATNFFNVNLNCYLPATSKIERSAIQRIVKGGMNRRLKKEIKSFYSRQLKKIKFVMNDCSKIATAAKIVSR